MALSWMVLHMSHIGQNLHDGFQDGFDIALFRMVLKKKIHIGQ